MGRQNKDWSTKNIGYWGCTELRKAFEKKSVDPVFIMWLAKGALF